MSLSVNPVSSAADFASVRQAQPQQTPPAPAKQDSVHISAQALAAAGGDADHDGDSH